MTTPREGSPRRSTGRRLMLWAGLAVAGAVPGLVGCQVEYAGMTLPSGKYLYDDVQHFREGPDFPWANTNAATQRARMQQMGVDVGDVPIPGQSGGAFTPPRAGGAQDPNQMQGGVAGNVNVQLNPPGGPGGRGPGQPVPPPPAPGDENAPLGAPF